MMYTIIDVETTGQTNRITEISIFKYDGKKVVDEFTTLVNPEDYIPQFITELTGIDNGMVTNSPVFSEISSRVEEITADAIFVAHNVSFDFKIISGEFKRLGIDFHREKLCTVKLSRKLLPGHKSYSLGKLCNDLGITIEGRHRARGDVQATVILFEKLLKQNDATRVFAQFLKEKPKGIKLPTHIHPSILEELPNSPGIYYLKDGGGNILYIQKAVDIKKGVFNILNSKKQNEKDICQEIYTIDFELSGSELVGSLMEDAAIKEYSPKFNKIPKRIPKALAIFSYQDRNGVEHLAYNPLKGSPNPHIILFSSQHCTSFLMELCLKFQLCTKFCHLEESSEVCSHHSMKLCNGICNNEESVIEYNKRVALAIAYINSNIKNRVIKRKGRYSNESAFVVIENDRYLGYGFVDDSETIRNYDALQNFLIGQKDNLGVQKIIKEQTLKEVFV